MIIDFVCGSERTDRRQARTWLLAVFYFWHFVSLKRHFAACARALWHVKHGMLACGV